MYFFTSSRLGFREWQESDILPFCQMNQNIHVMEFFPKLLPHEESLQLVERIRTHFRTHGFGLYAVDLLETQTFMGFIGFIYQTFEAPFTPCIEIGWRTQPFSWNQGYATEGALACLNYGFEALNFNEVYSFTALQNKRSERIMQKIGMEKIGTFDHPKLEKDSPLLEHVLYLIKRDTFNGRQLS